MRLNPDQVRRYSRHILLPDVGGIGQARLLAATVTLDPGGPAARIAAAYLAAAGIGQILLTGALDRPLTAADLLFPLTPDDLGRPLGAALAARVSGCRTGDTRPRENCASVTVAEREGMGLAEAMAVGGEAAARVVWRIAVGRS